MTTPFYFNHLKKPIAFFIFFHLLLVLAAIKSVAQDSTKIVEKQISFGNGGSEKTVTVKAGDMVEIQLKKPDKKMVATILSFTDASILIAFEENPYQLVLPIWNIAALTVLGNPQKFYKAKIMLTSGETVKGLVRLGDAEIELTKNKNDGQPSKQIAIADVKTIIIGRKKWAAIGIGAGIGGALGGIIGASVYKPDPNDWLGIGTIYGELGSVAEGLLIGALVGGGIGTVAAGGSLQTFKINGDPVNYTKMKLSLTKKLRQELMTR